MKITMADLAPEWAESRRAQVARQGEMLRKMHEAKFTKPEVIIDLMLVNSKAQCESMCSICPLPSCRWEG